MDVEMTERMENKSSTVAETPKQGEGTHAQKTWWNPSVWTDRMLAALVNGVKGGKWFSLYDKVFNPVNLESAWVKVKSNRGGSGSDGQSVHKFDMKSKDELSKLSGQLRAGSYVPQPTLRKWIPKPGGKEMRPLGIPAVRDRVAQTALRNVVEPIFEAGFSGRSYGFRPGRGCKDALREVDRLLKAGYLWIVDADLKSYFDTIPHEKLMGLVEERIADGKILALLRSHLNQGVMDGLKEWIPDEGTPQGAVISPLLANIYLNPLDHEMAEKRFEMVRYADDFVVLCRSREEADEALSHIREWTMKAELTLHPEKTRIVHEVEGFEFLGYRFEKSRRWPRKKSGDKLKDKIRKETRRKSGKSLEETINRLNATLRGWYGYFKHCHKFTFSKLDGWIRRRLRTILKKREGKGKWKYKRKDHIRWPNVFFQAHGLFSLARAHATECQSLNIKTTINRRAGCGKSASPVRREG